MSAFQEVPANNFSIARRKLVYGVGINNAEYMVRQFINGKNTRCPYYTKWSNMLKRCYSELFQKTHPAYIGCTTSKHWIKFSNFKDWMQKQDWESMDLDKDIKLKGNKIYSENACLFIPAKLNSFLSGDNAIKGGLPQGVSLCKSTGKFRVKMYQGGKDKHLGRFGTQEEALKVYGLAREVKIQSLIDNNTYPMATQYLSQHINQGSN